jgi:dTDP-4-dehydrorhamnose 3,5-epimerase
MRRFTVEHGGLSGLKTLRRHGSADLRGGFCRLFCASELDGLWPWPVQQINHSITLRKGTVRGMHFQLPPACEAKLVACVRGRVWDVATDLRAGSPTFLQSESFELSPDNATSLLIPPGFAHGFQALCDDCELIYLHSHPYSPELDSGLNPSDGRLGIRWPLEITGVSDKDANRPMLTQEFHGLSI